MTIRQRLAARFAAAEDKARIRAMVGDPVVADGLIRRVPPARLYDAARLLAAGCPAERVPAVLDENPAPISSDWLTANVCGTGAWWDTATGGGVR